MAETPDHRRAAGGRLLWAAAAALGWGGACGLARAPFIAVAIGGFAAAALGAWLERSALTQPVRGRRTPLPVLIGAAIGFLAIVGIGLAGLACIVALDLAGHR